MKRRNFLINSAAMFGGCTLFSGCKNELIKKEGQIARRKFKNTTLPLLGFGGTRFPMKNKDEIDMAELDKMVEYAISHGVNLFDTAYFYVNFKSETALAEVLKNYPRNSYFLADKMPIFMIKNKKDIKNIFNEQLKKCNVDYFDFYMAQGINENCYNTYKNTKLHNELLELKKEGKIRYLGFSFHGTSEILKEVIAEGNWDFCELQLNYFDWNILKAKEQYEIVQTSKLPIIAVRALKVGDLVNIQTKAEEELKNKYPDTAPAEFALRWTGSIDNVVSVISGMGNLEQIKQNVAVFENFKAVTEKEREDAAKLAGIIQSQGEINCSGCKHCLEDCPRGINIPANIAIYNQYKTFKNSGAFRNNCLILSENERVNNCIQCGLCSKKCPQGLKIPELLAQMKIEYEKIKNIT